MTKNRAFALAILSCALLASCKSTPRTVTYDISLSKIGNTHRLELVNAAERVATRRLAALSIKGTAKAVPAETGATLNLTLPDKKAAESIAKLFAEPFTIDIRTQVKPLTDFKQDDPTGSNWKMSTVGNDDFEWIQVIGDKATGKIGVELQFTPDGRKKFEKVFTELAAANNRLAPSIPKLAPAAANPASLNIGIFVRGVLVSALTPSGTKLDSHVIITGIPKPAMAQVFADDVNVGLHARFVPHP